MFDFLSRGRTKSSSPHTISAPSSLPSGSHIAQASPPSAAQREMVRLALHSMLRNKGIPGNWLTCEVTPIQIAGHSEAVLVQLIVLKWHDALMQYAPSLQQALLEGLKHFDAGANAAKCHFSWAFAVDCGYPHAVIPGSSFWNAGPSTATPAIAPIQFPQAPASSAAVTAAPTPSKPKFDLPLTAADIRAQKAFNEDDDDDRGFAATQVNEL